MPDDFERNDSSVLERGKFCSRMVISAADNEHKADWSACEARIKHLVWALANVLGCVLL